MLFSAWLSEVLDLFNDIFNAALELAVFRLFVGLLLLTVMVGLFRYLASSSRRL